jgi:uncharacterized protein
MSSRQIFLYAVLAVVVSWSIQIPAILLFGLDSGLTRIAFVATMWSPTVLALLFVRRSKTARVGNRWGPGRLIYLPVGIVAETLVAFGTLVALLGLRHARSGWFTFSFDGVSVAGGPWILGIGDQGWPFFAANVLTTAVTFSVIGLIAAVGEEFAWRGFFQGHLEREYGGLRAILAVALVWWLWHIPGLLAGYNFPETPFVGALLLFPLQMLGASLFLGWLTIRAGSFWPAALAHAAVNSIQQGVIDNLQVEGPALQVHLVRTIFILMLGLACLPSLLRQVDLQRHCRAEVDGVDHR